MPDFELLDNETGDKLVVTGPEAPTPKEMAGLFAIHGKSALDKKLKGEMAAGMPVAPTKPAFPAPDQIAPVDASAVTGQKPVMPPPAVTTPFSGPLPADPTKAASDVQPVIEPVTVNPFSMDLKPDSARKVGMGETISGGSKIQFASASELAADFGAGASEVYDNVKNNQGIDIADTLKVLMPQEIEAADKELQRMSDEGTSAEQLLAGVAGVFEGGLELGNGLVKFLTSANGIMMTAGMKVPILEAPIAIKFAADMIQGGYINSKEALKSLEKGDMREFGKQATAAFLSFLGAKHVGKPVYEKYIPDVAGFVPGAELERPSIAERTKGVTFLGVNLKQPPGAVPPQGPITEEQAAAKRKDEADIIEERKKNKNRAIQNTRPGLLLPSGETLVGNQGESHNEIIARNNLTIDQANSLERVFVLGNRILNRSNAAKLLGIPTLVEPGKLHSADLSAVQESLSKNATLEPSAKREGEPVDLGSNPAALELIQPPSEEVASVSPPVEAVEAAETKEPIVEAPADASDPTTAASVVPEGEVSLPSIGETIEHPISEPESPYGATQVWRADDESGDQTIQVEFANGDQVRVRAGMQSDGSFIPVNKAIDEVIKLRPSESILEERPAEALKPPTNKGRKSGFFIRPRSDGIWDILDEISMQKGLRAKEGKDVGGEYDGYDSAIKGIARWVVRKGSGLRPDVMVQNIQERFPQIKNVDDLYAAIESAVETRKSLAKTGGGSEAQMMRFYETAVDPKNKKNLQRIPASSLVIGQKFSLKADKFPTAEFTVTGKDELQEVITVRDGNAFGVQEIPMSDDIFIKKKSLTKAGVQVEFPKETEFIGDLSQTEPVESSKGTAMDEALNAANLPPGEQITSDDVEPESEVGPGLVGFGGAIPSEFSNGKGEAMSIKNADTDRQLAAMGYSPLMKAARKSFGTVWDIAMGRMETDENLQDNLIEELKRKPRSITDEEDAMLLHRQIDLRNDYNRASSQYKQAVSDKNQTLTDQYKLALNSIGQRIEELATITRKSGTETARGLNARKLMLYEDFSLAKMESDAVNDRGGKEFDPSNPEDVAQKQQIADLHAKIELAAKNYNEYVEKSKSERSESEAKIILAEQALKERAALPSNYIIDLAKRWTNKLHNSRDAARARIAKRRSEEQLFSGGLNPEDLDDFAVIAASHIADVGLDVVKVGALLADEFGKGIKTHIEEIWKAARKIIDQGPEGVQDRDGKDKVKEKVKREKPTIETIKKDISEKMDDFDLDPESSGRLDISHDIVKMARKFVEQGAVDKFPADQRAVELVKLVHNALMDIDDDLTQRDVMDAISGYGKYKRLSKDEISVKLRDYKGQMQQIAKLEDLVATGSFEKTGVEKRTPSDEEAILISQVRLDPSYQRKHQIKSRMSYYERQVRLLEKQIAKKERILKTRKSAVADESLKNLVAKYKATKELFEKTFKGDWLDVQKRDELLKKESEKLDKIIAEKERKLRTGEVESKPRSLDPVDKIISEKRKKAADLEKLIQKARSQKTASARALLAKEKELKSIKEEIEKRKADLAAGRVGAKKRVSTPADPEIAVAREQLKAVNEEIRLRREAARPKATYQERALKAYKTRLEKSIADLQRRIKDSDYSKKLKKDFKLDDKAIQLKAIEQNYKNEHRRNREKVRIENMKWYEKAPRYFSSVYRSNILTAPTAIGKLLSAATWRIGIATAEEAVGGVLSQLPIIKEYAAGAPREGYFSIEAESRAISRAFTQGMKDASQLLRTGTSDLELNYGKQRIMPREWTEFVGNLHSALKSSAKRNEFERSFAKRMEYAIRKGVEDPTDMVVQTKIAMDAYKDATRSVFQDSNMLVEAYKRAVSRFTQQDVKGETSKTGNALAFFLNTILPIVKIPTNIASEVAQYSVGSLMGVAQIAIDASPGYKYLIKGDLKVGLEIIRGSIDGLSPEAKDLVMRNLKKGSLGAALLVVGYYNPTMFGGYYQPGEKRAEGDIKAGQIRLPKILQHMKIAGYNVTNEAVISMWIHNPLLEVAQIGATISRVADSYASKHSIEKRGLGDGIWAAAWGVTEQVPFVDEMTALSKIHDPEQRDKWLHSIVKSATIPRAIQWAAEMQDSDENWNPIKREQKTLPETLKSGIPFMRQTLEQKMEKVAIPRIPGMLRPPRR